jgi:cytochrome c-type biogenesis protein CcmH/NrfF
VTVAIDVTIVLAHAGASHWYDYVLWVGPMLGIAIALLIERRRLGRRLEEEKRAGKADEGAD